MKNYWVFYGIKKTISFVVYVLNVFSWLGVKNMSDLVRKEIHDIFETKNHTKTQVKKYKRRGNELDNSNATFVYVRSDLMSRIIKNCRGEKRRGEKKEIDDFRCKLGFKLHDITMSKEESVTIKIIKAFSNEKILLQHPVLNYQIDLYFPEHKLAIEVDEKGHTDRDEKKRKMKEKKKNNTTTTNNSAL